MVSATFRFHHELNDFLPRERRGRSFEAPCARSATTKHMIEALGVPHTEVEVVLVNGQLCGFNRVLEDGDRVSVYPRFEEVEAGPQAPRLRRMRFVADAHLGGLARLLRMAGFDTLYDNHYHDADIEEIARDEDRIVLTRDRELLKRRSILHGCYLHTLKPQDQLRELFGRLDLAPGARPFTLCLHCNLPLRPVAKCEVAERLPPSVRDLHDSFTTCEQCLRVYWKGSHYQRMHALLASMGERREMTPGRFADVESLDLPDSHS